MKIKHVLFVLTAVLVLTFAFLSTACAKQPADANSVQSEFSAIGISPGSVLVILTGNLVIIAIIVKSIMEARRQKRAGQKNL